MIDNAKQVSRLGRSEEVISGKKSANAVIVLTSFVDMEWRVDVMPCCLLLYSRRILIHGRVIEGAYRRFWKGFFERLPDLG